MESQSYQTEGYTISSLIKRLEYLKLIHGDLPVYSGTDCDCCGFSSKHAFDVDCYNAREGYDARPLRVVIES